MKLPFQVMCVLPVNYELRTSSFVGSTISVGSEYTVISLHSYDNRMFYCLKEMDENDVFDPVLFATLPSTTEEQGIEAEQEAIIYQR